MLKRGGTKHCCWGLCNSDSRYPERLPEGTFFIRFPKPGKDSDGMTQWQREQAKLKTEKAKRWQFLCGRSDFQNIDKITRDTYICSLHFVGGKGPTSENDEPILATLTDEESHKRLERKRKAPAKRTDHTAQCQPKRGRKMLHGDSSSCQDSAQQGDNITFEDVRGGMAESSPPECKSPSSNDKATQTMYNQYILGAKIETMIMKNDAAIQNEPIGPEFANRMDPSFVLEDRKNTKFLLGLFPEQFYALYNFLGPAKYNLKYWDSKGNTSETNGTNGKKAGPSRRFTPKEELFITLLRLRRGLSLKIISYLYDTSESLVSRIFITWIQFMFLHFKSMNVAMFPTKAVVRTSLPKVFRRFKNVRCSVDCTEFFCQTPRDYGQQGNVYSSYKHHTTMKALIAVTPKGAACFVSDLYEGSVSDVEIFEKCGILQHIEPGDVLLVDKGFKVQDLLLSKQATIKIPAFLGKRASLTAEEEMDTRRVAKARIHVERFNERLKKFNLLSRTIPLSLSPVASQMVYVGCCLVNFQSSLCV